LRGGDVVALLTALTFRSSHTPQVLCTIKVFRNNTMEVTPGFSEVEPEDETNPTFASSHELNVRQNKGSKLSTFRFTTPRGSQYEYTLENKNSIPSIVMAERMLAEETYRDMKKVEERRNRSGKTFFGKVRIDETCDERSERV
jgi:hypothetical protein